MDDAVEPLTVAAIISGDIKRDDVDAGCRIPGRCESYGQGSPRLRSHLFHKHGRLGRDARRCTELDLIALRLRIEVA